MAPPRTRTGRPCNPWPRALPCQLKIFTVGGRKAFLLLPNGSRAPVLPWVWYAPTLSSPPDASHEWMFGQWLNHGIAIAGVDVGESFGNPAGRAGFTALYEKLTGEMRLAPKACLLAQSRGGLMHYNWAAEIPAEWPASWAFTRCAISAVGRGSPRPPRPME